MMWTRNWIKGGVGLLLSLLLLGACGDREKARSADEMAAVIARAQVLVPADPALAEIYDYSCRSCHANPETGAPLTGDKVGWAPRVAKGLDVMLDSAINGYKGMPPLGMCMDCSAEQFIELIAFMADLDEEGA